MDIKAALAHLVDRKNLSTEQMSDVIRQVMTGGATDAQIGALLIALRMKGETIDEIAGAAQVMRELSFKVHVTADNLVDTCGTGGDGSNLFNVSTACAFVVAAAGGHVAKHGNRSVSSTTGSADVLEAAGVRLDINAAEVGRAIEEVGLGFMFAPAHHSAMRFAIGPRKELAMRTIFNMLGPLTNPAEVTRQIIGVFSKDLCRPIAEVLAKLGSEKVMVVHSEDGLDEISLSTKTFVAELSDGQITEYELDPQDFGIEKRGLDGLAVESAQESLELIKSALGKDDSDRACKARDLIILNAGAAIYVSGLSSDLASGIEQAADAIGSGMALAKISDLANFTHAMPKHSS